MSALEIWRQVTGHYYELKLEGDSVVIEATDFSQQLPPGLIGQLKAHKSEILELLRYQEEADSLLLGSTKRLAASWPKGCDLDDDPRWRQADKELHAAYWTLNIGRLKAVLELREKLAMKLFDAHRRGAAA